MQLPTRRAPLGLPLLLALGLGLAWSSGCGAPTTDGSRGQGPEAAASDVLPLPAGASQRGAGIQTRQDERVDEAGQKERRERWIEELHKAPPGVDWRAVERANARAQVARRARLAGGRESTTSNWSERGSENQSGNVVVAARSSDGQSVYCGSALGGLWRADLQGDGWTPLSDHVYGGVHHLGVLSPDLPGFPDPLFVASDSGLVFSSRDGGSTWTWPNGIPTASNLVRRLRVSTDGLETIYVLLRQGGYKLFRSVDRGYNFEEVYNLGNGAVGDVWVPRDGTTAVYLFGGGKLRKSTDQGTTWTELGTLPVASTSGELAGSEGATPRLYCMIPYNGNSLYRSDDEGATWSLLASGVSDYWGQLNVSSVDPDLLAYGGVECWVSRDAGLSFSVVNTWGAYYGAPATNLHADIMGIDVIPDGAGAETWYVSSHGGLYDSQDGLASVANLSLAGLRVSQYYSTHTSTLDPDHLVAGTQDQGYQIATMPAGSPGVLNFAQPISGDYAHLVSGDGDHDYVYSVYPGFVLIDRVEGSAAIDTASFPSGESYAWLPPLAGDPLDDTSFFFCATSIWQYQKGTGNTWSPVQWTGGPVSTGIGDYVSALAFSPLNVNRAYCATNSGKLYWSDDRGVTWTQSADTGPGAHYFYGHALVASALDEDTVYVGGSGYGVTAIYRSTDGGQTFQPWDDGLPDTLVYSLVEEPGDSGAMYCGTQTSAYRRGPEDTSWVDITDGVAPATIYWSAEAVPSSNVIRFGTYGRGIWDYEFAPLPSLSVYGCGGNPAGSLTVLGGEAIPGTEVSVLLDNPLGTMSFGALSYMLFSFAPDPNYPCGTLVPGLGMDGGSGELLIGVAPPDPQALVSGSPWLGVGLGAVVQFDVPDDASLLGTTVYGQGLLFDPTSQSNKWGLTEGLEIGIGL